MAENTTENAAPVKSEEDKAKEMRELFESLPSEFKDTINKLNAEIDAHNANVVKVKRADEKDPKLIKAEIYEQNPDNNEKLAVIRKQELKLIEQMEKLRKQAYEVIEKDGLMPKDLSPEEVEKLKKDVTESTKSLKDQATTLEKFEEMMPLFKGKLTIHLHEIKTRRGTAKSGGGQSAAQTGVKRPRFKKILVNGSDQAQDPQGNTHTVWQEVNGEPKYTMTFLSQFLKKMSPVLNWTPKDLQDAYFGDKSDQSEIPDTHKFVMTHTFKNEAGNEQTVNYEITAIK